MRTKPKRGSDRSSGQRNINAEPGQNIVLPCRAPDSRPVIVVEWTRNGLGSHSVYLYRDAQIDQLNQHPTFKNRVELQDREMKDGDVSLTLRNVTSDDRGTYECRVVQLGARRFNLDDSPTSIINLDVAPREFLSVFVWIRVFSSVLVAEAETHPGALSSQSSTCWLCFDTKQQSSFPDLSGVSRGKETPP
ncbi:hypothetical protein CRENBAI_025649 [Crenichthys baileyi]|uniref:Ig-like domain-containing protein n=1 Tax=Crenichthys baileyi TaxID=28760 RepID=A0AAV9SJS7_9TELE